MTLDMKEVFSVSLFLVSTLVLILSVRKSQRQEFFSDTFSLAGLGIFVWGDGLILAPFWMLSSVFFFWLPWISIVRWWLAFIAVREAYEVIYWLNHQATKSQYRPPFLRHVSWLSAEQQAIIYQLLAMCQVLLAGFGLFATYQLL